MFFYEKGVSAEETSTDGLHVLFGLPTPLTNM
jgi:hypothetical protein